MGFFSFFRTPDNLGVGTGNLALAQRTTVPIQSIYGERYNVRRALFSTRPPHQKFSQSVPIVSIEGNGSYVQGQMALQALVELSKVGGAR